MRNLASAPIKWASRGGSDFVRLAQRIRRGGLIIHGSGERKTPEPSAAAWADPGQRRESPLSG
jgi:hypothetical protein